VTRAVVRAVVVSLVAALAVPAASLAGVKTEERTQVQFTGLLGGLMSHFGGKAAKEGLVNTVAVVADRRLTLNEETGEIVDLAEGKVYELNVKDRTYEVATFEEIKKRFEEQREKAQKEAEKAQREQAKQTKQEPPKEGEAPEFEVDVRVSRTGEKRTIAGHEAAQWITRISAYPKGSSLQQSGGMAIVNEQWMAPDVPELKEIADFNLRYAQKMADVFGFDAARMKASAEQMAALLAAHPGLVRALEKMKTEGAKIEGTPLATILSINVIRSAQEVAKAEKSDQDISGGVSGFLAKKLMKKAAGDPTQPKQALMTSTIEMLKITTNAAAADVALPAGYKQK
jgi:hypothetical protein